MNTIVLGQPYAGALLGFFSDQIGKEGSHTRAVDHHPYYRALFGPDYRSLVDISITFLLLYDEVWLCPADTHWPESRTEHSHSGYVHELALNASWDRFHKLQDIGEPWLKIFREDSEIKRLLQGAGYPVAAWDVVVSSAVYEMVVAKEKNCAILCSLQHRMLIERMLAIQKASLQTNFSDVQEIEFVAAYNRFTGLSFKARSIDDLLDVKSNSMLREYSRTFLSVASNVGASQGTTVDDVARLMEEAIETEATSRVTGGLMTWAGSVFRAVDAGSALSGAIALGGVTVSHLGNQASWFQFSGAIHGALDKRDMLRRIKAHREARAFDR